MSKKKVKLTQDMLTVLNYILEEEQEDYWQWCDNEGIDPDSSEAMNAHVYGAACKVLGLNPIDLIQQEVANES